MRVLADENILEEVVIQLRAAGYNVCWVKETVQSQAHAHILN